jgi:hypothetical protein
MLRTATAAVKTAGRLYPGWPVHQPRKKKCTVRPIKGPTNRLKWEFRKSALIYRGFRGGGGTEEEGGI